MTGGRCRITRTASDAHRLPAGVAAPDPQAFRRLQGLIRRYLSPAAASVLAEPVPSADGSGIDWYTSLGGQPSRLCELPDAEQQRARRLLETRLGALRELARRLPDLEPGTDAGPLLLQATAYPGDEAVFVVGGQPVVTFWAYGALAVAGPEAPDTSSASGARALWPWFVLTGLLLAGLSGWGAFHFSLLRWPPWGPDPAALLAAERSAGEALRRRLLDRQGELAAALGHCALREQVDALRQEQTMLTSRMGELAAELRATLRRCE